MGEEDDRLQRVHHRAAAGLAEAAQDRLAAIGGSTPASGPARDGERLDPNQRRPQGGLGRARMRETIRLATVATRSGSGPPASGGSSAAATSPSADMARILG